jgi:hypothetical protein
VLAWCVYTCATRSLVAQSKKEREKNAVEVTPKTSSQPFCYKSGQHTNIAWIKSKWTKNNDNNSGHYVLAATPHSSACTSSSNVDPSLSYLSRRITDAVLPIWSGGYHLLSHLQSQHIHCPTFKWWKKVTNVFP